MKRSQVRALLRKARETLECHAGGALYQSCPALELCDPDSEEGLWFSHAIAASMLLDGLDVLDVTEAGG